MKVELGSGYNPRLEYDIHVDIRPHCPHVEVVADVGSLGVFADNSVDEIGAFDVLEHVSHRRVRDVLREWLRILKLGGTMTICTPHLRPMAERYLSGERELYVRPNDALAWSYWIFGGQDYDGDEWVYNAHFLIMDRPSWERLAREVGFAILDMQEDGGTNLIVRIQKVAQ